MKTEKSMIPCPRPEVTHNTKDRVVRLWPGGLSHANYPLMTLTPEDAIKLADQLRASGEMAKAGL